MTKDKGDNVPNTARELHSLVQRIERLNEEKKALATDITEIYTEANSRGFDKKVLREIIKRRAKDKAEIEEFDATLAVYETNLDSILE